MPAIGPAPHDQPKDEAEQGLADEEHANQGERDMEAAHEVQRDQRQGR
ncbi:MAG TPA: hypothetical protein VHB98_24820 [Chloroflexota bacterium]|nr:hypothetical protein [Chloroflexota bacterium]